MAVGAQSVDPEAHGIPAQGLLSKFHLMRGVFATHEYWRLITYAFLHAGWMHLIGNMIFLWVFGPNVEDRLGRVGFVCFYLAGAVGSGLSHIATSSDPVIGASGA